MINTDTNIKCDLLDEWYRIDNSLSNFQCQINENIINSKLLNSKDIENQYLNIFKLIINDNPLNKSNKNYNLLENTLVNEFLQIIEKTKNTNKLISCDFNIFDYFPPNEPTHSFLIADLLNPQANHGQGNLFLKIFLDLIGIEKPDLGFWVVTAEKGRIDILLKRKEPHSVVIIENKSNFAIDQENQLYRYWFQEMYYPNRIFPTDYVKSKTSNYKIIYLTPADWKVPTDNSLSKPDDWDNNLPDKIPIEPIIINFKIEIIEWLQKSLKQINSNNHRLIEYIKQYIELWK